MIAALNPLSNAVLFACAFIIFSIWLWLVRNGGPKS